ncbi:flavodoxin [Anaerobacillus sp. MEB173]|uniref:flavodoxin n=1 Tax=Anaerobacillus sp. MEB173 TaxID=3383345 RepID=UPI003F9097B6
MKNVLLVYTSMSGNTEEMADLIKKGIESEGVQVEVKEVMDVDAIILENYEAIILENYEAIVLGAYTWGEGALPDDFIDFYDDLEDLDLSGKIFAVFGSGDTSYEYFCGAVDLLEERVKEQSGSVVLEGLKVELNPEGEDRDYCITFGVNFAKAVKGVTA